MGIGRTLEATVIYDAPDGRTVYRPWGARGPCYLVAPSQRWRFTLYARVWYGLLLVLICTLPFAFGPNSLFVGLGVWFVASYGIMAILPMGLPKTDPPPRPSVTETNEHLKRIGVGPRALRVFMALGVFMTAMSLLVLALGSVWQGLLGAVVFGGFTWIYWRRIRSMSASAKGR